MKVHIGTCQRFGIDLAVLDHSKHVMMFLFDGLQIAIRRVLDHKLDDANFDQFPQLREVVLVRLRENQAEKERIQ